MQENMELDHLAADVQNVEVDSSHVGKSPSKTSMSSMAFGFLRSFSASAAPATNSSVTTDVPGHIGTAIVGDESLAFARNPTVFVQQKQEAYGPIFKARVMNRATVFVSSNDGVKELLEDKYDSYSVGFLDHMKEVLGENILFSDGEELSRLRSVIMPFFSRESVERCMPIVHQLIKNSIAKLPSDQPIAIYSHFKRLASELSLALFLGMDVEEVDEMVDLVVQLGKTHWHGFISVPLKFIPSFAGAGFSMSIDARDQLLEIIRGRLEAGKLRITGNADLGGFSDNEEAARHILMFISALIPKAFGSLLTSFCLETRSREDVLKRCLEDDQYFDDTLLEVSRMWPPFLGSRRISKVSHHVQGLRIPENTPVVYMTYAANHDEKVFPRPGEFLPERWSNENSGDRDRVFTLGSGGRQCIGKVLVQILFKECAKSLLTNWRWTVPDDQDLSYKWLPVSRPSTDVVAIFQRR